LALDDPPLLPELRPPPEPPLRPDDPLPDELRDRRRRPGDLLGPPEPGVPPPPGPLVEGEEARSWESVMAGQATAP